MNKTLFSSEVSDQREMKIWSLLSNFLLFTIAALTPSARLTAVGSSYHKLAAQWQNVHSSENAKGKICKIFHEYKAQDVLGKPSIWTPTRYRGPYLTEGGESAYCLRAYLNLSLGSLHWLGLLLGAGWC